MNPATRTVSSAGPLHAGPRWSDRQCQRRLEGPWPVWMTYSSYLPKLLFTQVHGNEAWLGELRPSALESTGEIRQQVQKLPFTPRGFSLRRAPGPGYRLSRQPNLIYLCQLRRPRIVRGAPTALSLAMSLIQLNLGTSLPSGGAAIGITCTFRRIARKYRTPSDPGNLEPTI